MEEANKEQRRAVVLQEIKKVNLFGEEAVLSERKRVLVVILFNIKNENKITASSDSKLI